MRIAQVVTLAAAAGAALAAAAAAPARTSLLPGFRLVRTGADGGTVWVGKIPGSSAVEPLRPAAVYVPPRVDPGARYPVVYLLHGMPGSPSSFYSSLRLADVADSLIASGRARPFFAVIPWGGPAFEPRYGEWAGVWEDYVVRDVVSWTDAHLPTIAAPSGRTLAGLSAGGFGAVDIGLRHPGLFGTLESWDGYFAPVFHDGPFAGATERALAAHTPSLLVRREARSLRRHDVRFFLSTGPGHGGISPWWTFAFAHELGALRLAHRLWVLPSSAHGHFYRTQLAAALAYAAPA